MCGRVQQSCLIRLPSAVPWPGADCAVGRITLACACGRAQRRSLERQHGASLRRSGSLDRGAGPLQLQIQKSHQDARHSQEALRSSQEGGRRSPELGLPPAQRTRAEQRSGGQASSPEQGWLPVQQAAAQQLQPPRDQPARASSPRAQKQYSGLGWASPFATYREPDSMESGPEADPTE